MVAEERDYSDVDAIDSMNKRVQAGGADEVADAEALRKEWLTLNPCPYVIFKMSVWTNGHSLSAQ